MATTIVVVDYGMGNLRSVAKALEHVAPMARVLISGDPAQVRAYFDHIEAEVRPLIQPFRTSSCRYRPSI